MTPLTVLCGFAKHDLINLMVSTLKWEKQNILCFSSSKTIYFQDWLFVSLVKFNDSYKMSFCRCITTALWSSHRTLVTEATTPVLTLTSCLLFLSLFGLQPSSFHSPSLGNHRLSLQSTWWWGAEVTGKKIRMTKYFQ